MTDSQKPFIRQEGEVPLICTKNKKGESVVLNNPFHLGSSFCNECQKLSKENEEVYIEVVALLHPHIFRAGFNDECVDDHITMEEKNKKLLEIRDYLLTKK